MSAPQSSWQAVLDTCQAYIKLGGATVSAESTAATCKDERVGKGAPVGRAPFAL